MKRLFIAAFFVVASFASVQAQKLYVHQNDKMVLGAPITTTDSVKFSTDGKTATLLFGGMTKTLDVSAIDSLTFGNDSSVVSINYGSSGVSIVNPLAFEGVTVATSGNRVTVNSTTDTNVTYRLSGTTTDGQFKIYSDKKFTLNLNGVSLTSTDGPAINIQSKKKADIVLSANTVNTLSDGTTYTAVDGEDMKACLFSEGQLVFSGSGKLSVTSKAKHAICSDDYVSVEGGTLTATAAVDGVHANDYFSMSSGTLTVNATSDGIDADGYINISGGQLKLTVSQADTKGIKCDSTLTVSGGTINITLSGAQSKGFKTSQEMDVTGGDVTVTASGAVVVTSGEPSYCAAVKTEGNFNMSAGTITVTHTGAAGKGISCDSIATITGGTINITTSGNGSTYTNSSNTTDSYSATCITCDGNMTILGGTLTLKSTGSAGKGMTCDGNLVFGDSSHSPTVSSTTTGAKFSVGSSTSTGGFGGFGPGGGGGMQETDYANPKAIKAGGNLTINNGTFTVSTAQDGGEGIESKNILTINGGTLTITTYDDGINASKQLIINGGNVYSYASGNDGIDSNGTMTITGGTIIASGTNTPEEGFDCDQNTFTITGGILVGMGGSTSTPTSSACKQASMLYSTSASQNTMLSIVKSDGTHLMSVTVPRTYNSMTLLYSAPALTQSTGYTIYTGGTVTGGTTFKCITTGGTYKAGTSTKTFTQSSLVTTVR